MKILSLPHLYKFLLMNLCPFSNKLTAPFRQTAFYDVHILKLHHCNIFAIFYMNMPWRMLVVNQEHPNDNSVKSANFWHSSWL